MKRAIVLAVMVLMLSGLATSSFAGSWLGSFPDGNQWVSLDRYSWDYYDNAQLYFNNNNDTVAATILDYDGYPLYYYWFDMYSYYYDAYYSTNGVNWYYLGSYYY